MSIGCLHWLNPAPNPGAWDPSLATTRRLLSKGRLGTATGVMAAVDAELSGSRRVAGSVSVGQIG